MKINRILTIIADLTNNDLINPDLIKYDLINGNLINYDFINLHRLNNFLKFVQYKCNVNANFMKKFLKKLI
jgi:hypothetical protein